MVRNALAIGWGLLFGDLILALLYIAVPAVDVFGIRMPLVAAAVIAGPIVLTATAFYRTDRHN